MFATLICICSDLNGDSGHRKSSVARIANCKALCDRLARFVGSLCASEAVVDWLALCATEAVVD
jgi:hypothetical protein